MRPAALALLLALLPPLAACSSRDERPERSPAAPAPSPLAEVAPAGASRDAPVRSAAARSERIHIDVEDADLRDVMDQIGRQVGRNILVDRGVQESVTVTLHDVHWREAVDLIARMCRCEVEVR